MRPDRRKLHMLTALLWARRSTCKRPGGQNGAVITTADLREVISIGYNGPAKDLPNDRCRNQAGACGCLHAEDNAISLRKRWEPELAMFVTTSPCEMCAQRIIQVGVTVVYYNQPYRDADVGLGLLAHADVCCHHLPIDLNMDLVVASLL